MTCLTLYLSLCTALILSTGRTYDGGRGIICLQAMLSGNRHPMLTCRLPARWIIWPLQSQNMLYLTVRLLVRTKHPVL